MADIPSSNFSASSYSSSSTALFCAACLFETDYLMVVSLFNEDTMVNVIITEIFFHLFLLSDHRDMCQVHFT